MTIEIRDVGLILSEALKMNMREVASYYGSRVNNTTVVLRIGSVIIGKSPTYQLETNLSEYIAKQVPCQSDSYSKQEPNVRTLWPDVKMMVSSPFYQSRTNIAVRQSKSLEDREIGKHFCALVESFGKLEVIFLDGDDTGTFIVAAPDVRSQVLSSKDRRNGVGKPEFKLAPLGNGQVFALTAPYLHVPGIPDDMLQQVISQASTAHV